MWGAIKKAINSTLGTKRFSALDVLAKKNTYNCFYNEWRKKNYSYDDEPKVYPMTAEKKINLETDNTNRTLVILPPEVEEIEQPSNVSRYSLPTCFLPYGIKKANCKIKFNSVNTRYGVLCYFPETVENISEDAFADLRSSDVIIIDNKKDDLQGHPWGHPAGDAGIIYIK